MFEITSPRAGHVRGSTPTEVTTDLARAHTVRWLADGRPLGPLLAGHPFAFTWHTTEQRDGPVRLVAVGYDSDGHELARTAELIVRITNGSHDLRLLTPDARAPWRGSVTIVPYAWRTDDEQLRTYAYRVYVDGELVWRTYMARGRDSGDLTGKRPVLDTTQLADGEHELRITAELEVGDGLPGVALTVPFTVANEAAARELRAAWSEVFLAPGETVNLAPLVTLDSSGTASEIDPGRTVATVADAAVAAAQSAEVRGLRNGVTTVTLEADGRTTEVRVTVAPADGFPHLARDGGVLGAYDPTRSLFVRTLDHMGGLEDERTRLPLRHVEANAITRQFHRVPHDQLLREVRFAGLPLLLLGDEIAREPAKLAEALRAFATVARSFAVLREAEWPVIGVEMVDEILGWKEDPVRPGGWPEMNPPIPQDAFVRLMDHLNHDVPGRPPIAWPMDAGGPPELVWRWMQPGFSDYISIFSWGARLPEGLPAYADGYSLSQAYRLIDDRPRQWPEVLGGLPYRPRPRILLTSGSGGKYRKRGSGDRYVAGRDELLGPDLTPRTVAALITYAATVGMAGVRVYKFDHAGDREFRGNQANGAELENIGYNRWHVGSERWQAIGSAFAWIARLEPYLIAPQRHAPDVAGQALSPIGQSTALPAPRRPRVLTSVREGAHGRLVLALNLSERSEPVTIELDRYRFRARTAILRLHQRDVELWTTRTTVTGDDTLTLTPGEAVAWVIPAGNLTPGPPVRFLTPMPGAHVADAFTVRVQADPKKVAHVELHSDVHGLVGTLTSPSFGHKWRALALDVGLWHGLKAIAVGRDGGRAEARTAIVGRAPRSSASRV